MPRPQKKRQVCSMPKNSVFFPADAFYGESIVMTVDEYETVRLIDLEGYTQEDCAASMGVARTTIQGIYAQARKKLADALVNGKRLLITGGDYALCKRESCCGKRCCPKKRQGCWKMKTEEEK